MVLDIIGDLLSQYPKYRVTLEGTSKLTSIAVIFIPCRLIWSVKLPWTQKLALAFTLCLTILTIMCTIIRIGGIRTGHAIKSIDSVWATYWQFVAANIAVTMTAATAFRTFFVSRSGDDQRHAQGVPDGVFKETWYSKSLSLLRSAFSTRLWHSWRSKNFQRDSGERNSGQDDAPLELTHRIPRATLTGMRTFIDRQAISNSCGASQYTPSVGLEEYQENWPLSAASRTYKYTV